MNVYLFLCYCQHSVTSKYKEAKVVNVCCSEVANQMFEEVHCACLTQKQPALCVDSYTVDQ